MSFSFNELQTSAFSVGKHCCLVFELWFSYATKGVSFILFISLTAEVLIIRNI